jgi:hypothetical protein
MRHRGLLVMLVILLLLGAFSGCVGEGWAARDRQMEERLDHLERSVVQLTEALDAWQRRADEAEVERVGLQMRVGDLSRRMAEQKDTVAEDELVLHVRIGELARRIAEVRFERFEGTGKGLLDCDAALQAGLRAIEQPADLSYILEDVSFIENLRNLNPSISVGPAWQFTIQGALGQFIVAIDAESGQPAFTNKVG